MDPFSTALMLQAGGGLLSSLFAKDPPKPQPLQSFQQQIPQYQAPGAYVNPTPANLYDVGQSQLYQNALQQLGQINAGGSALPDAYRQAVLGQAQQNFGLINDRLKRSNMEQANLHGLLGSGSLGEQNARQDESYLREMGNVSSNLTQQDLAQRNQLMAMLQQMEGQRAGTSQNAYSMGLQQSNQQNQYNLGTASAANQYAMQGSGLAAGQQALQYQAGQNQANFSNNQMSNMLQGAGNLYNSQGMGQLWNQLWNKQGNAGGGNPGGSAYQLPSYTGNTDWAMNQMAGGGRAYNRVGFGGS